MKTEFLRNYIKLAQSKGSARFSDVAKELSISQSTLSHQISQIEKELDISLIERSTRSFELTDAGRISLGYAKKIIELYDSLLKELLPHKHNKIEKIIITASTLPGAYFLPKYIANFKVDNPNVNFEILINNSKESMDLLKNKQADFAGIGSFMGYKKKNFELLKLGEEKLVFVCSPNNKLSIKDKKAPSFTDLIQFPFINREKGSGTRNIFESEFERYADLNSVLEINDNDSIISAVSESNSIAVLSEIIAQKAEDAGLLAILNVKDYPIIAKRDIFFIKLKDLELSGLKKKFWQNIKKEVM